MTFLVHISHSLTMVLFELIHPIYTLYTIQTPKCKVLYPNQPYGYLWRPMEAYLLLHSEVSEL